MIVYVSFYVSESWSLKYKTTSSSKLYPPAARSINLSNLVHSMAADRPQRFPVGRSRLDRNRIAETSKSARGRDQRPDRLALRGRRRSEEGGAEEKKKRREKGGRGNEGEETVLLLA